MGYEVNRFCYFIPLQHSVFILGYLKLFVGVLAFVLSFEYFPFHYYYGPRSVSFFVRIIALYYAATALLLLAGGHLRKSLPILSYYWISIAYSVLEVNCILAGTITTRSWEPATFLIIFAIEIYFTFVIRRFYEEMVKEQENATRDDTIEGQPITSATAATAATAAIYPTVPTAPTEPSSPHGYMLYNTANNGQ